MTNEQFIEQNKNADVRSLALKRMPEGVNSIWCLRQIEGYQLALRKLPRWSQTPGIHYPPKLSMEQCSSESTALYKQGIVRRLVNGNPFTLMDITGGFGVDFSYMAQGASRAVYVEQQQVLCEAAHHNMPLLGLPKAEIVNAEFTVQLPLLQRNAEQCNIIFADPARRDDAGRKTVAIEDCTPDICNLQETLLAHADFLMVKLSPMLDITQALRSLRNVIEVHVVSVKGECKELLFIMQSVSANEGLTTALPEVTYHSVNLETEQDSFICSQSEIQQGRESMQCEMPCEGMLLVEPNASILKCGVQEAFAQRYGLSKLHPMSNLYLSAQPFPDSASSTAGNTVKAIPGRCFGIMGMTDFSKQSLKHFLKDIKQANLTVRNFPSTVADLRKRLKLKEGGSDYLFATTLYDSTHALLKAERL